MPTSRAAIDTASPDASGTDAVSQHSEGAALGALLVQQSEEQRLLSAGPASSQPDTVMSSAVTRGTSGALPASGDKAALRSFSSLTLRSAQQGPDRAASGIELPAVDSELSTPSSDLPARSTEAPLLVAALPESSSVLPAPGPELLPPSNSHDSPVAVSAADVESAAPSADLVAAPALAAVPSILMVAPSLTARPSPGHSEWVSLIAHASNVSEAPTVQAAIETAAPSGTNQQVPVRPSGGQAAAPSAAAAALPVQPSGQAAASQPDLLVSENSVQEESSEHAAAQQGPEPTAVSVAAPLPLPQQAAQARAPSVPAADGPGLVDANRFPQQAAQGGRTPMQSVGALLSDEHASAPDPASPGNVPSPKTPLQNQPAPNGAVLHTLNLIHPAFVPTIAATVNTSIGCTVGQKLCGPCWRTCPVLDIEAPELPHRSMLLRSICCNVAVIPPSFDTRF